MDRTTESMDDELFEPARTDLPRHDATRLPSGDQWPLAPAGLELARQLLDFLPAEEATQLMLRLPPSWSRQLRAHRVSHRSRDRAARLQVVQDFAHQLATHNQHRDSIAESNRRFLSAVSPSRLALRLASEQPQATVAVLMLLPADRAAEVVAEMATDRQQQILDRFVVTRPVPVAIQRELAATLARDLARATQPTPQQQRAKIQAWLDAA